MSYIVCVVSRIKRCLASFTQPPHVEVVLCYDGKRVEPSRAGTAEMELKSGKRVYHESLVFAALTFPEAHAAVVPRGGQQRAGDVPAHAPHLRVVVVKLRHDLHLKLGGSCGRALLPGWRRRALSLVAQLENM